MEEVQVEVEEGLQEVEEDQVEADEDQAEVGGEEIPEDLEGDLKWTQIINTIPKIAKTMRILAGARIKLQKIKKPKLNKNLI